MQSARIWNWAQTFSAIYCLNIQLIGHTRATKHTCQSHVPILLLTWKMGGFKQKVPSSKLFIRSRYEYLEIKAEMLISHLIFIFWCQTQMFSVYSKNKGIGLTVPILLEGTVYIYIYIYISAVKRLITSKISFCLHNICVLCIFIMYI